MELTRAAGAKPVLLLLPYYYYHYYYDCTTTTTTATTAYYPPLLLLLLPTSTSNAPSAIAIRATLTSPTSLQDFQSLQGHQVSDTFQKSGIKLPT